MGTPRRRAPAFRRRLADDASAQNDAGGAAEHIRVDAGILVVSDDVSKGAVLEVAKAKPRPRDPRRPAHCNVRWHAGGHQAINLVGNDARGAVSAREDGDTSFERATNEIWVPLPPCGLPAPPRVGCRRLLSQTRFRPRRRAHRRHQHRSLITHPVEEVEPEMPSVL